MNLITKRFIFLSVLALSLSLSCQEMEKEKVAAQPNFLWLSVEDLSPRLGCYGDQIARGRSGAGRSGERGFAYSNFG